MLSHYAYVAVMDRDDLIDARGLLCPLPVLKLRKRLKPVAPGACVELWADDPAAIVDVPHFCAEAGHRLISIHEGESHQIYVVEKA
jgi:tRNA 2-thiouridine synthesizing protein A